VIQAFQVGLLLTLPLVAISTPSEFVEEINGYRSACKKLGWEPKQGVLYINLENVFSTYDLQNFFQYQWRTNRSIFLLIQNSNKSKIIFIFFQERKI
jgi:hypothetical protein